MMLQCDKCKINIAEGEDRQHLGQILCEDCYMERLSPAKPCEPWAVYSAKSFANNQDYESQLTPLQKEILALLQKEGPTEPRKILARLQINETELEREVATLRHMEKLRGELMEGKRMLRLWDA
jgi:hypothetical protein